MKKFIFLTRITKPTDPTDYNLNNIYSEFSTINKKLTKYVSTLQNQVEKFLEAPPSILENTEISTSRRDTLPKSTMTSLRSITTTNTESQTHAIFNTETFKCLVNHSKKISNFLSEVEGYSFLAFEDKNSYLAAQKGIGLALIKNGKEIYSSKPHYCNFIDVTFANGYYFLYEQTSSTIWRKSVDYVDPEQWYPNINLYNSWYYSKSLRTGLNGKALVCNHKGQNIVIIEIREDGSRGDEMTLAKHYNSAIADHKVMGDDQNLVVTLSLDGWVVIYSFDIQESLVMVVSKEKLNLNLEQGVRVCVCPRSRYLCLHFRVTGHNLASRIVVMELENGDTLVKKDSLNVAKENLHEFTAIEFYEYYDHHLIICAMTWASLSVLTFHFDTECNHLVEMKKLRTFLNTKNPWKMCQVGDTIYSSDNQAMLITVKYKL